MLLRPRFLKGSYRQTGEDLLTADEGLTEHVLYKEGGHVQEMYFIQSGEVAVGYTYMHNNRVNAKRTHLTHIFSTKDFVGDFYTLFNLRSQYHYEIRTDCSCFALNKQNLLKVLSTHPTSVIHEFQERAKLRYERLMDSISSFHR